MNDVWISYTIDYTCTHPKDSEFRLYVYEVQHTLSNHFKLDMYQPDKEEDMLFKLEPFKTFIRSNLKRSVLDLPITLEENKVNQRIILSDVNTKKYLPHFLIYKTEDFLKTPIPEYHQLENFIKQSNYNVVVKATGLLGSGNYFINERRTSDPEFNIVSEIKRFIKNRDIQKSPFFLIEEAIMCPYLKNYKKNKHLNYSNPNTQRDINALERLKAKYNYSSRGIFRRDVIFYNCNSDDVIIWPIYKQILNTGLSTDNHSDYTLYDKQYTSEYYDIKYNPLIYLNRKLNSADVVKSEHYRKKSNAMRDISRVLSNYIHKFDFERNYSMSAKNYITNFYEVKQGISLSQIQGHHFADYQELIRRITIDKPILLPNVIVNLQENINQILNNLRITHEDII
ncbi:hypothetical protein [Francisella frigiditurris]|uniref:Uncharacterized protein n=1 Tax=Francisella frigiditurris TaxID=1542390 RepID=A0A1J0KS67_9GAMM|nr:hypothetical protein [Francisella frigiditurris]APC96494.1 hypothetical protein KX01_321 [Francisella frigiditurris]